MQKDSAAQIIALFKRYRVSPAYITIEITEEQAFSNADTSMHNIQLLSEFGCAIAIDDFGTGYANYERLKSLQADIVKLTAASCTKSRATSLMRLSSNP